MAALVEVARPGNVLMAGIGAFVGALVATGQAPGPAVALTAGATMLVTGGGNGLNDLTDAAIDRAAHPARPLPAGRVSRGLLRAAVLLSFLAALALGALVSGPVLALVAGAEALLLGYELVLKARGLAGNLVVAGLVAATFLAGALATGRVTPSVGFLSGSALMANVARELWKDAEDAAHDAGRATVARQAGTRTAHRLATAATLGAIVLSPLPLLVGFGGLGFALMVAVADVIFIAALLAHTPAISQRLSKAGMVVALVAFAVGAVA